MPRIDRLWYDLEINARNFQKGIMDAESTWQRFFAFMKNHPVAATLGSVSIAAGAVGAASTVMAAKFEHSMREIATLVDVTKVNMKDLGEETLQVFENMPLAIEDITRGLYEILSANIPVEQAIETLSVAAKSAVANVTTVESAVDGMTSVLNAFSADGLTAVEVADKFFTSIKIGKVRMDEISSSIGNAAGTFGALGLSLDELLAAMTTLSLRGINASYAFQGLRQMMANVAKPAGYLKELFPDLAKDFDLARLKTDGLAKFMSDLAPRIGDNTKAMYAMFGSVEAANAAMALMNDGGAKLREVLDQIQNSAGENEKAFNKMNEDVVNLWKTLKNQFSAELIRLGENILPPLNAELKGLVGIMQLLNGTIEEIHTNSAVASIETLRQAVDKLSGQARIDALNRLMDALEEVGGIGFTESKVFPHFDANVVNLNNEQLQTMARGLTDYAAAVEDVDKRLRAQGLLDTVFREMNRRNMEFNPNTPDAASPSKNDTGPGTGVTPDDNEAQNRLQKARDFIMEVRETLADDMVSLMAATELEMEQFQATALEHLKNTTGELHEEVQRRFEEGMRRLSDRLARLAITEPIAQELEKLRDVELFDFDKDGTSAQIDAQIAKIAEWEEHLMTSRSLFLEGSKDQKAIDDLLRDLAQERLRLQEQLTDEEDRLNKKKREHAREEEERVRKRKQEIEERKKAVRDAEQERIEGLRDQARIIKEAANAALELAAAFGIVDEETTRALQSLTDFGTGLLRVSSGDLTGIFDVVGGLAGFANSIIGESPEQKAFKEAMQENTKAIAALAERIGELGMVDMAGEAVDSVTKALRTLGSDGGMLRGLMSRNLVHGVNFAVRQGELDKFFKSQGTSRAELQELADQLGVQLDFSNGVRAAQSLQALQDAINELELAQFTDTFVGQMQALRAEFELFDIDKPIDQLKALVKLFSDPKFGSPALQRALAGLNLDTAEGRAEAEKRIRALFEMMQAGTLTAADLGGLSAQEFLDALLELEKIIDSANEEGVSGGQTEDFSVNRTITEVTALRMISILVSSEIWLQHISDNTDKMTAYLASLSGLGGGGISAPVLPPSIPQELNVSLTIHLPLGVDPSNAGLVGAAAGSAAIQAIDTALGYKARIRQRLTGNVVIN